MEYAEKAFETTSPGQKERTGEEIERINAVKEDIQAFVDRATTTVNMALENKFITDELKAARLYKFLEKVAEEANDLERSDKSTDEVIAGLKELYDKVKLPGDIEQEKNVESYLERLEQEERQRSYKNETTANIDRQLEAQKRNRNKNRR
ncbi:MAG: hypothetical protein HY432_03065 [Candidatus Liptonbacteria bacterium]|nr:hypothetical protein [Candidatus Liptonbacteria bacterium]